MVFVIYKDTNQQWRWRFVADNNEIIAVSSESYVRRESCLHALRLLKRNAATTGVYDITTSPPLRVED